MKFIGPWLLTIAWLLPSLAAAQEASEADVLRLSLVDCIDLAIKKNVSVRLSELDVLADQAALEQSKADLLPSLNANTSYSYSVGRTINEYSYEYVNEPVQQQNMSVTADVVVFNSFRKLKTIKRNKLNLSSSQYGLEAQKNDVLLDVVQAYTQILLNQELLRNSQFTENTTQSQLERTRRLVEAGSLPMANALQLEAQQATDELNIINAENNLALAELNLKQLLQIPDDQDIEIIVPDVDVPETTDLPSSVDEIYAQALNTLPQIKQANDQISAAQYSIDIAKADFYPSISLSGSIFSRYSSIAPPQIPKAGVNNVSSILPTGDFLLAPSGIPGVDPGTRIPILSEYVGPSEFTDNTYINQVNSNLQRYAQVNLRIPIFNNWQVRSNVSNARIGLEQSRLNALNQRNSVRQTIEQVYLDVKSNAKEYQAAQRRVVSLQRAFQDTERRYQAQAIDIYAYNQAKNDLTGAEANLLQAKYNYLLSLKVLDFYQGKPVSY
uniref:TolC family protein n=1 Tax=Roseihalotalea indica TaxID=2867963 RepID=A0AA49GKG1_9BACT|nr:TolC family protein [Tunicatimonas sp. TK19036]